jgi:outer membrane protein OmpA-like peptidoglycan-associated protein
VNSWTTYREFYFDSQDDDIRSADMVKVSDIAAYVQQNPSLQIGIDGNRSGKARINSVRTALIQAGVPSDKIKIGDFGDDRKSGHNGSVEVLFRTAK